MNRQLFLTPDDQCPGLDELDTPAYGINYEPRQEEPLSDHITHISDSTFEEEVLNSSTPVLVDYWAEWCGPCKAIGPVLEDVAPGYSGKVKIVKMNIDENPNTPPKYGIRSIPTLMLFKNGTVESTKVGSLNKSQLTEFLDEHA